MIALLSTLALAQDLPDQTPSSAPATVQVQANPAASDADYQLAFQVGAEDGALLAAGDFVLYGVGASVLGGNVGCCGMAAVAYLVEPEKLPSRSAAPVPNAYSMVGIPPAPIGMDETAWAQGYADGWTKAVQRKRASRVLIGGATASAVLTVAVAAVYVAVLGTALVGFNNAPLAADVP